MRPIRIVPTLIATCLIASTSCSDAVAPTWSPRLAAPAKPLATLQGVAQHAPTSSNDVKPSLSDGGQVALAFER